MNENNGNSTLLNIAFPEMTLNVQLEFYTKVQKIERIYKFTNEIHMSKIIKEKK